MNPSKTVPTSMAQRLNRAFQGDAGADPELIVHYIQDSGEVTCPRCGQSIWSDKSRCHHGDV